MKAYEYWRNCVNFNGDERGTDLLIKMIDSAIEITYRTFFSHCDLEEARSLFDYEKRSNKGLTLKDDWHISYHRSKYDGDVVYFLQHSGIEYIWTKGSTHRLPLPYPLPRSYMTSPQDVGVPNNCHFLPFAADAAEGTSHFPNADEHRKDIS